MDRHTRETIKIYIEEDLYPLIAVGAMDREAARFLASHPKELKKWREDRYRENTLLKSETPFSYPVS